MMAKMGNSGKDMEMAKTSLFSGGDSLTARQLEAKKQGLGHKRQAKETTIFEELNDMANRFNSDDEADPYALSDLPRDLTQRRKYATNVQQENAVQPQANPRQKRNVIKPQRKRAIVDESDEEESVDYGESEESSAFPDESSDAEDSSRLI